MWAPTDQNIIMGTSYKPKQWPAGADINFYLLECGGVPGPQGRAPGWWSYMENKGNNSGGLKQYHFVNAMEIFHYFQSMFCS